MSTKATVAYGSNFHLYKEVLDDDFIYLRLEGVQFEASYNQVMVPIPIHIWEVIRQYSGVDLSWSDKTDDEITQYVEQEVNERIEKYQKVENESQRGLLSLCGSLVYGMTDTPYQEQLEQGVTYFKKLRDHQQQIKQAIEKLKAEQSHEP